MVYSEFTIDRVRNELGITLDFSQSLFRDVAAVSASGLRPTGGHRLPTRIKTALLDRATEIEYPMRSELLN
jgi:hypothetical protein